MTLFHPERSNLNSKHKTQHLSSPCSPRNNTLKIPTVKFSAPKIGPEDTVAPTIELSRLVDPKQQDVYYWLKEFYLAMMDCSWDSNTSLKALKLLLGRTEDREAINLHSTFEGAMKAFIDRFYPLSDFNYYYHQLESLDKSTFSTITEFHSKFKELVDKTNYCCKASEKLNSRETFGIFIKALPYKDKELVLKEGISSINEAVIKISSIEESLARYGVDLPSPKATGFQGAVKPSFKNVLPMNKYCAYHKRCNHVTKECKKLDELKSKERTLFTKDIPAKIDKVTAKATLNKSDNQYTAYIDTGSTFSIISTPVIKALHLEKLIQPINQEIVGINNDKVKIIGKVNTVISFTKIPRQEFNINFLVAEVTNNLVLIGNQFLNKNYVKIDFGRYLLTIDDKTFSFAEDTTPTMASPDYELLERNTLFFNEQVVIDELINNHFPDPDLIGNITGTFHEINLTSDVVFAQKPYKLSEQLNLQLKKELNKLESKGIIRKSNSKYASPAFVILKRNGNIRLVVDYRKLNAITISEAFPFPCIEDQIRGLEGSTYFSQIDLNQGFYQISMKKEDVPKTSFVVPSGQYEFLVMPFGLKNSPRSFQRAMVKILGDLTYVKVFLDDILVFSKTKEEHLSHLEIVMTRLKIHGSTINREKSHFFQTQVEYLGVIIDKDGVRPCMRVINQISTIKKPNTINQVRKVLGMINYFRAFIPNLSSLISPITNLLKGQNVQKNSKINWKEDHTKIINRILNTLKQQPMLHHPDSSKRFKLQTDASEWGIGGALYQDNKLIGLYSSKFLKSEYNYPIIEKEALSIVKSLKYFKPIIFHSKILVETDHSNLKFMDTSSNQRISRWRLVLADFDYEINYIKGETNTIADGLSRLFFLPTIEPDGNITFEDLKNIHYELMHPGTKKMYETIKNMYPNNKIPKEAVRQICSSCITCHQNKPTNKTFGISSGTVSSFMPFEKVHVVIYGPIKSELYDSESENDKTYFLSIIDNFLKVLELVAISDIKACTITGAFLENWLYKYPIPKTVVTDQGTQFLSNYFEDLLEKFDIYHHKCLAYNPMGNSIVERVHRDLGIVLKIYKGQSTNHIGRKFAFVHNNTYHSSLNDTPHNLIFMKPKFRVPSVNGDEYFINNYLSRINQIRDLQNNQRLRTIQQRNRNRKEFDFKDQLVFEKKINLDKTESPWKVPFKVLEDNKNYQSCLVQKENSTDIIPYRRLKPLEEGETFTTFN